MATVKLNVSLDEEIVHLLKSRATQTKKPASRYLAQLFRADARRHQDELAAEGYRFLSADTGEFAEAAWPLAAETWPGWEDANSNHGNSTGS
ncbi:MAG: hypothetical protein AUJ92_03480 [Armatimonadetes bacterium CG2_30_59_28]|nr:hypothetical protein [Armatimonadota bacterium]OIO97517.1 MAG: hypothetical protein AUJ92_03480 [Armatimonadetes bacterium CG2_30_59_28]PIU64285.1 MAG: hypothetical protein COS85_13055 [Armatimonadetes bacterium CG07_land_8_20_14_0_80_59_28]PIX38149.1 MAG: hypothetical protein COZ56_21250 [Armatimonadetes bacterium CG_4_8_14_3_um_filter_58_9]PIY45584.1 MAG: hypothetical protein COZ05_06455 [Armatimonadetes bacterium CG_4_10_14_3_um_filter_59_10]PJB65783.1 MAG: hypothetical protein CO095_137